MSTPTPTLTGAYTCTHHNDRERAACPVCLVTTLTAERDQLRADRTYNHECINRLASATGTLGEKSEKVVDVVLSTIDQLRARAARAEDNLAALEQCHDDNCRGVVRIADELAAERERLNWVFHNCKVTSDDFTVHDREDLGVAMKEDAK